MECGLTVKNYNDIKVGDMEAFEEAEVAHRCNRTVAQSFLNESCPAGISGSSLF